MGGKNPKILHHIHKFFLQLCTLGVVVAKLKELLFCLYHFFDAFADRGIFAEFVVLPEHKLQVIVGISSYRGWLVACELLNVVCLN